MDTNRQEALAINFKITEKRQIKCRSCLRSEKKKKHVFARIGVRRGSKTPLQIFFFLCAPPLIISTETRGLFLKLTIFKKKNVKNNVHER